MNDYPLSQVLTDIAGSNVSDDLIGFATTTYESIASETELNMLPSDKQEEIAIEMLEMRPDLLELWAMENGLSEDIQSVYINAALDAYRDICADVYYCASDEWQ